MSISSIIGMVLPVLLMVAAAMYVFYVARRYIFTKTGVKEIVEAEQKRQACPDVQNGIFNRLYTMPYYEQLIGEQIAIYCHEHYPKYYCSVSDNMVKISESPAGLYGETRELYITHLPEQHISALELVDPDELVPNGRFGPFKSRHHLYDNGFSKDIREMIRYFQQSAISQQANK